MRISSKSDPKICYKIIVDILSEGDYQTFKIFGKGKAIKNTQILVKLIENNEEHKDLKATIKIV
jgi:hypothetical protein